MFIDTDWFSFCGQLILWVKLWFIFLGFLIIDQLILWIKEALLLKEKSLFVRKYGKADPVDADQKEAFSELMIPSFMHKMVLRVSSFQFRFCGFELIRLLIEFFQLCFNFFFVVIEMKVDVIVLDTKNLWV